MAYLKDTGQRRRHGSTVWKDKLTGFGNASITYDAQGNPINYLGHTLTWEKGRQLKSFDGIEFSYNASGIRTSAGMKQYVLDGSKIVSETFDANTLIPLYDSNGEIYGIQLNGEPYFYQKNLQGDILKILDKDGNVAARYEYDAWGACTTYEFQALDINTRDRCLKKLRESGLSIRQISRLTEISFNIVRKF